MSTPRATSNDDRWLRRSRDLLQRSAEHLDPAVVRGLSQARQAALDSAQRRPRWPLYGLAAGVAMAASWWLAALLPGLLAPPMPVGVPTPVAVEAPATVIASPVEQALTLPEQDLDLIANPDDYVLLQELEFYAWLETADRGG